MIGAALTTQGLSRRYGGVRALDRLDLEVAAGELHAVIGPNGAGKTTLFDLIAGAQAPDGGRILLDGREIGGQPAYRRAGLGLARTFQTPQALGGMTVIENVMLGRHAKLRAGLFSALFRTPAMRREEAEVRAAALAVLDRLGLATRADDSASALGFGERRLLEIARALAAEPRLLLLDEPAAGLPHAASALVAAAIVALNQDGLTVLLVEHDMRLVMRLAHRITVLDRGVRIATGTPAAIRRDPAVLAAYLGDAAVGVAAADG